jgi:hypothetical protein
MMIDVSQFESFSKPFVTMFQCNCTKIYFYNILIHLCDKERIIKNRKKPERNKILYRFPRK